MILYTLVEIMCNSNIFETYYIFRKNNFSRFVIYEGNAYFAAAYPVAKEKSTIKLPTGTLLYKAFTQS